jgi:PPOX class probable F420-dependent enzyme
MTNPSVRELLERPNHGVISTYNADGSILSAVVWVGLEDGAVAVNSSVGRLWPANLERDPRVTILVYDTSNPYNFVEIRGIATGAQEGADEHIDRLARKYLNQDRYPFRAPGEQRIMFTIAPQRIRYQAQS